MILNSGYRPNCPKNYFAYIASDKSNSFFIYRQKFVRSFYFFNLSVMVNQQPSQVDISVCQESITTKRPSNSYLVWVTVY